MTYKNKYKGKNFLDAVYSVLIATNVNVQEDASLNSLQNAPKKKSQDLYQLHFMSLLSIFITKSQRNDERRCHLYFLDIE